MIGRLRMINDWSHNIDRWGAVIQTVAGASLLALLIWYIRRFFVLPLRSVLEEKDDSSGNMTPTQASPTRLSILLSMLIACGCATIALVLFPVFIWRETNAVMLPVSIGAALIATTAFIRMARLTRHSRQQNATAWLTVGLLLTFITWTPFLLLAYRILEPWLRAPASAVVQLSAENETQTRSKVHAAVPVLRFQLP